MNKLKLVILLSLVFMALVYFKTKKEFREHEVYLSPDGKYTLVSYIEKDMFRLLSSSSEHYHRKTYVILKNQNGEILTKRNLFNKCTFPLGELYVEWKLEQGKVYFSRKEYIDLKTLKTICAS